MVLRRSDTDSSNISLKPKARRCFSFVFVFSNNPIHFHQTHLLHLSLLFKFGPKSCQVVLAVVAVPSHVSDKLSSDKEVCSSEFPWRPLLPDYSEGNEKLLRRKGANKREVWEIKLLPSGLKNTTTTTT